MRVRACAASELPPGEKVICQADGVSVGVFNVNGRFFALQNRCPHRGGPLCEGPVTGTTLQTDDFRYVYGRDGEVVRCAWHGWEFEIATGRSLVDPHTRVKTFPVEVENGAVYVVV